jgi:hypothetical protein
MFCPLSRGREIISISRVKCLKKEIIQTSSVLQAEGQARGKKQISKVQGQFIHPNGKIRLAQVLTTHRMYIHRALSRTRRR